MPTHWPSYTQIVVSGFDTATIEWGVDGWPHVNDGSVRSVFTLGFCLGGALSWRQSATGLDCAAWNDDLSRVEMHLVSVKQQRVCVSASELDITFAAGESIWTESSYKYDPRGIVAMLDRAHFDVADQWIADGFALTLGEVR